MKCHATQVIDRQSCLRARYRLHISKDESSSLHRYPQRALATHQRARIFYGKQSIISRHHISAWLTQSILNGQVSHPIARLLFCRCILSFTFMQHATNIIDDSGTIQYRNRETAHTIIANNRFLCDICTPYHRMMTLPHLLPRDTASSPPYPARLASLLPHANQQENANNLTKFSAVPAIHFANCNWRIA